MPTATYLVRDLPPYPYDHMAKGLENAGYNVTHIIPNKPKPGDILVTWNRIRDCHMAARRFENPENAVIIAENGWIGRLPGRKFYALCLNHHNGAGEWNVGGPERWATFGIDLKPWREDGRHILVVASRGIGEPGISQPINWLNQTESWLRNHSKRPIKVRRHPGDSNASMEDDFKDCHAVVTWASGGGIKAIAAGIPVFYGLKNWIGALAAKRGIEDIENPFLGDRLPMFQRLAWAQWTADEIMTGKPILWLLKR